MAPKHTLRLEQGATFRRTLYWRQPLADLASGEFIRDDEGNVQPGAPMDLTGYTARMHIRKTVRDATPLLALTTANGGITISAPVVSMRDYVRVATTANVDLGATGLITLDGVALVEGDRVLVKDQTTASQNGIYTAHAAGGWLRAADADQPAELTTGAAVWVYQGTRNSNTTWRQTAAVSALSDPQTWVQSPVGRIEVVATDEQTATLTSSGVYDIELESAGGEVHRLVEGKVRLSAEVTR